MNLFIYCSASYNFNIAIYLQINIQIDSTVRFYRQSRAVP